MKVLKTDLEGVLIVEPTLHCDRRGSFMESFNEERFCALTGLTIRFVQDNESRSCRQVVRGLHYQLPPYAQAKLVRVVAGRVWDVAVDLRRSSPTFGRYVGVELSGENRRQLYIPQGFAHGFVALSDEAVVQYKCDQYYHPEAESGIRWDDPTLAILWPVSPSEAILSERDAARGGFDQAPLFD